MAAAEGGEPALEPLARAGLLTTVGAARPEWFDYNGHLMDGYYAVAFSAVTDTFLDLIGFGPAYPPASGHSVYSVESHLVYLREVRAMVRLVYTTQVLGHDDRRIHLIHTMAEEGSAAPAATNELMLVHVRQQPAAVAPMPPAALERLAHIAAAHATYPPPPQAGRRIALQARPTPADHKSPPGAGR